MFRVPSLVFVAVLMTSASAFAADTPDPNATGPAALPSGSNAASPSNPPAGNTVTDEDKSGKNATATSPGEENKGKPPIKTE
jgi:hypothetical protein